MEEQPKKRHGGRTALIVFGSIILFIIVIAAIARNGSSTSTSGSSSSSSAPATVTAPAKPDLEVLSAKWQAGEYASYIVGSIKNNTDKEYSYIQISFSLYDADQSLVGTAFDNVSNLESGGTWKFKAMATEEGVKSWKLKDVSGW